MIKKIVRAPNLTELTYRSIKRSVLLGGVGHTFRLTEEYLASHLGISKSPVREALNRLESEGFIRIEARRGAFVRQFSAREIRDLYDLRILLEDHTMATAVITPELLAELAASIARSAKILAEGDRLKHIEEDLRFHSMLADATGNEEFRRVFENVQQKSLLCRMESYELSATRSPAAHKRIYQAMLRGDRQEARKAMREHILFVRDRLLANAEARAQSAAPAVPELAASAAKKPAPRKPRATRLASSSRGKKKHSANGSETLPHEPFERFERFPASS